MKKLLLILFSCTCSFTFAQKSSQQTAAKSQAYFPPTGSWQKKTASEAGLDAGLLNEAMKLAQAAEIQRPRDQEEAQVKSFGREPFGEASGPFSVRGEQTGIVIHKGYIIAEWGEPDRVDMTHSVTKSLLSTVVGLAYDQKLISSVTDTVAKYIRGVELVYQGNVANGPADQHKLFFPFEGSHNGSITWQNLLQQNSDWEGTLWGKPDWADRPSAKSEEWLNRKKAAPGTIFEYNDVRVNVLALAATHVWRTPLPKVLKSHIMDPIGASVTWRWTGNKNAWIVLDGEQMQSVSGGGHWGGGVFINAYDQARFGLLTLNKGNWNGRQLISADWIAKSRTPSTPNPDYGYMNYFLNTGKKLFPSAPASAYCHLGNGANIVYVDEENDLVVVLRWIDDKQADAVIGKIIAAVSKNNLLNR